MEAISAGTPVIAFRSGALPEVVEHGVTGFIVDSEHQIGDAWEKLDDISPETCRAQARLRFDSRRMVNDYISLYRRITQPLRVNVMRDLAMSSAPHENL